MNRYDEALQRFGMTERVGVLPHICCGCGREETGLVLLTVVVRGEGSVTVGWSHRTLDCLMSTYRQFLRTRIPNSDVMFRPNDAVACTSMARARQQALVLSE